MADEDMAGAPAAAAVADATNSAIETKYKCVPRKMCSDREHSHCAVVNAAPTTYAGRFYTSEQ